VASPSLIGDTPPLRRTKPRRLSPRRRRDADCLDADTLKAMQHAVSEALRREYKQSPSFAIETAGEMVNEAYAEYAEKPDAEQEQVRNLPGVLVTTAVHRAIDKARKEGREIRGEGAQAVIDGAEDETPSTEALALRGIEAAEVFEAVAELHHEQRHALKLLYWEELTVREAAERMRVGTMTLCRRRDDAMDTLRARFGIEPSDPINKHLRKQAGYSAWTIFVVGPAAVHTATRFGDQLAAGADTARSGIDAIWNGVSHVAGRAKELATRAVSSGGGESVGGAISNGSAGTIAKGLGVCGAGLVLYCGAGVVGVGPGVGIIGIGGSDSLPPAAIERRVLPTPSVVQRQPLKASQAHFRTPRAGSGGRAGRKGSTGSRGAFTRHRDNHGHKYTKPGRKAVRKQSLGSESAETPIEAPEAVEPEPSYVGEPEGGGEDSATAAAQQQFGLP
jgi:RNA polymerase sigma-70 factor, ECF subfamily